MSQIPILQVRTYTASKWNHFWVKQKQWGKTKERIEFLTPSIISNHLKLKKTQTVLTQKNGYQISKNYFKQLDQKANKSLTVLP